MRTERGAGRRERLLEATIAAGAVALLGAWWQATERLGGADAAEALTALGRVTGLLAAYLCLVVLLLMARIPSLERAVGLLRLAAWHRVLGSTVLVLVLAHVVATVLGYAATNGTTVLDETADVLRLPGMVTATVATGLLVLVGLSSAAAARRRLGQGVWWALHLTVYAAVILGFAHQVQTGDDFVGRPEWATAWRWLVLLVLAAVAWWRIARPLADAWARRTHVRAVEAGGGGVSVWLEGDGARRRDLRGGGFVLVRFLARGLWASARPYSVTEVGEGDGERLRLVVRRGSPRADRVARLRAGTRAILEGPFRNLDAIAPAEGAPVLVIGAGSGVTPLRPVAADLAARGHDVVFVHRASSREQQVLGDDLRALAASGAITLHDVLGTRDELGRDPLDAGRLASLVPDLGDRELVVCAPAALTAKLVRTALAFGVREDRIHVGVFAL